MSTPFQPAMPPDFGFLRSTLGVISKQEKQAAAGKNVAPLDVAMLAAQGERDTSLDCCGNLNIGIFFDGTNNNKDRDWGKDDYKPSVPFEQRQHTNVVRLYLAYPDEEDTFRKEKKYSDRYYKYYIPGVGTPFKEIGDTGKGVQSTLGGAAGIGGESRILWGMIQVVNAINRFYRRTKEGEGVSLIDDDAAKTAIESISADSAPLQVLRQTFNRSVYGVVASGAEALDTLSYTAGARYFNYVLGGGDARNRRFKEWLDSLKTYQDYNSKPSLLSISIDVFGFSRGAAEARAFTNWMVEAFQHAAGMSHESLAKNTGNVVPGELKFGKIPVRFRFLGIFDTVASVGAAGMYSWSEGRMLWADDTMQIPPQVGKCLHLVAAHEVRGCFPLDSVRVEGKYPPNATEVVYPGSHSDLGGGYALRAYGKDNIRKEDGVDTQISRIPCFHMYAAARAADVPFYSTLNLKALNAALMESFLPALETVNAMEAYVNGAGAKGPVEEQLRTHMGIYLGCRWLKGEEYLANPDFKRLGIDAAEMIDVLKNRKILEKKLGKVKSDIETKEGKVARIHQYRQNLDYGYDDRNLYSLLKEIAELGKRQSELEKMLTPRPEADLLWQTQDDMTSVLALYCAEIAGRTTSPDIIDKAKQTLLAYKDFIIPLLPLSPLYQEKLKKELNVPEGQLINILSFLLSSRQDLAAAKRAEDSGKRTFVVYEHKKGIENFEDDLRKNDKHVNQALEQKFSASRAAVECLKLWRDYLAVRYIPEVHDTDSPEKEPIWLLEALQDIQERQKSESGKKFINAAIPFFADQVYDSLAGFMKDAFNEYTFARYGIAKFRRVYFGNRGDACLREKVAAENEARKAAVGARKAADEARQEERAAQEEHVQRNYGKTFNDFSNARW
jgi:hypothetical protein